MLNGESCFCSCSIIREQVESESKDFLKAGSTL